MESNNRTSSVAPIVGGFAFGAMCGLLLGSRRVDLDGRAKRLLPPDAAGARESAPMTPQELAEECDLTANL